MLSNIIPPTKKNWFFSHSCLKKIAIVTNIRGVGVNPRHILQQVADLAPCHAD